MRICLVFLLLAAILGNSEDLQASSEHETASIRLQGLRVIALAQDYMRHELAARHLQAPRSNVLLESKRSLDDETRTLIDIVRRSEPTSSVVSGPTEGSECQQDWSAGQMAWNEYREGRRSRDTTLEILRAFATACPESIEADQALFLAGMSFVQGLPKGVRPDREQARVCLLALVNSHGPWSSWRILAEEELASYGHDPRSRFRDRSLLLKRGQSRRTPDEIWQRLEVLLERESPERFAKRLVDLVCANEETLARTAYNVTNDALQTPHREELLTRLEQDCPENIYVVDAVLQARERLGIATNQDIKLRDRRWFWYVQLVAGTFVILWFWRSRFFRVATRSVDSVAKAGTNSVDSLSGDGLP